jgi:hypothetical protein
VIVKLALHVEGPMFESLTGERHFMVLLSLAGQITDCFLERGNAQFLPHPFQFVIHSTFPFIPVDHTQSVRCH